MRLGIEFSSITLTLLLLSSKLVNCREKYQVSKLSKCPPTDSKFLMLLIRSVEECVDECKRRKSCKAFGFKRSFGLCELYTSVTSSYAPAVDDDHCMSVDREDEEYNCEEWKVYEPSAENGKHCVIKECKPQEPLQNGKYLGNMNQVGSKKAIICDDGYVEKENMQYVECTSEGKWTYDARCIDLNECDMNPVPCKENHVCSNTVGSFTCKPPTENTDDTSVTMCSPQEPLQNGKYLGNTNQVGSKNKIICDDGYVEKTNTQYVECTSEGKWTYDAQCIDLNECDEIPVPCDEYHECVNTVGSFICNYLQVDMEANVNELPEPSNECDVDSDSCGKNHVCCNTAGSSTCEPFPAYTDDTFATNCPREKSGWVSLPCSKIQIPTTRLGKSQEKAVAACAKDGAKLVTIDQQWKMNFIVKLLEECNGFRGDYWVDGSNANADDAWRFSDGSLVPTDQHYWYSNAPNNARTERCLRMRAPTYRFDNKECEMKYGFICEK